MPSMVWTTSGRLRRDEVADRLTTYYWMFGIDLSHAVEIAGQHPYQKPAAANRDFIPTFEAFGREVWRGIVNAKNFSGANDTDPTVISTLARRLYDMMATRRINGNLSREEFRAVAIMSYLASRSPLRLSRGGRSEGLGFQPGDEAAEDRRACWNDSASQVKAVLRPRCALLQA